MLLQIVHQHLTTTAALLATELAVGRTKIYSAIQTQTRLTTVKNRRGVLAVSCDYPTIWKKSALLGSFIDR